MYRENSIEASELKSDDFKKLKKEKEELFPATFNSDAVKGVQSFLNEEGYKDKKGEKLFVDGRYGAKTANAVMDYQRENGLSVDGIVGDETWDSIYRKKKKKEERIDKASAENWWGKNDEKIPDVWRRGYNTLAENKNEDSTKIHKGEIKGLERSPLADRVVDSLSLKSPSRSITEKYRPVSERHKAGTEILRRSDYFSNDKTEDYPVFKDNSRALDTDLSNGNRQNEYGYFGKAVEKVWDVITEIKENVEEKVEQVKNWADKAQIGRNKDYRGYYDFEKTPAKEILTEVFDDAMEIATKNQNMFAQASIYSTRERIKNFDEKSIVTAYYLNGSDGAGTFGHAGVLLVNKDGEGILFSYYPKYADDYASLITDYSDSEMRIEVLGHTDIEKLLNGETISAPSTSGEKRSENYNRYTRFDIGTDKGKAMFEQGVAIAGVRPAYNVLLHNCDHMALSILWAGKILIDKDLIPNNTYRGSKGIDV